MNEREAVNVYRLGHSAFSSINPLSVPIALPTYNIQSDCIAMSYGCDSHGISSCFFQSARMSTVTKGAGMTLADCVAFCNFQTISPTVPDKTYFDIRIPDYNAP